jgi:phage terminase large subunit-like protein
LVFQGLKTCDLSCEKQKDASDNLAPLSFIIKSVELDEEDSKGNKIQGACVIPVGFVTKNKSDTENDIALNTVVTDKSEWQKDFVAALTGKISDGTKKRKFRETVKSV